MQNHIQKNTHSLSPETIEMIKKLSNKHRYTLILILLLINHEKKALLTLNALYIFEMCVDKDISRNDMYHHIFTIIANTLVYHNLKDEDMNVLRKYYSSVMLIDSISNYKLNVEKDSKLFNMLSTLKDVLFTPLKVLYPSLILYSHWNDVNLIVKSVCLLHLSCIESPYVFDFTMKYLEKNPVISKYLYDTAKLLETKI